MEKEEPERGASATTLEWNALDVTGHMQSQVRCDDNESEWKEKVMDGLRLRRHTLLQERHSVGGGAPKVR